MIFALLLVVAFLAVPPVSAKDGAGYTVRPSVSDAPEVVQRLADTIAQGETDRHQFYVGSGVAYLEVYLAWHSTSDALALTVYSPSWSCIGTYHDNDDGIEDGNIHIDIVPDSSPVEQGTWTFNVYGEKVSSPRTYSFNLYEH
ncbi:MAG: hypothetical protein PWP08_1475 [Methanofollis sp.]|nr:hypothetical protein [Methanofollis sp.]